MRRAYLFSALVVLILALSLSPASAQETTGRLEGRVLDANGHPIPEANITITGPSLQGTRGAKTTSRGYFTVQVLPVGEYTVIVSHVSYQERKFEAVRVRLGQTTTLGDVRLEEQTYVMEAVTVESKAPIIDPVSTVTGATLDAKEYEVLPIARDYRSVATLLPEANQNFLGDPGVNFEGATGLENGFYIDGIDETDPFRGLSGTRLPYNFVQEVEVRTGGYQAEYRGALGGTVNAVTYSGSNKFTAQAFGFFTNDWLSDTPRSVPGATQKGNYALYDVGVGFGGPIKKDRLWYYLAYNPTVTSEDVMIPGNYMAEDKTTTHSFAAKLTWRANDRNTLLLTIVGDPTERHGVGAVWQGWFTPDSVANPDSYLMSIRTGTVGLHFEGRHILRDNLLLMTALSYATRFDRNVPANEAGWQPYWDDSLGIWWGGSPGIVDDHGSTATAAVTCTWSTGAHELKGGVEYRDIRYDFNWNWTQYSAYPGVWSLWSLVTSGQIGNRIPGFFLQDSWRLTQRLQLNAGARWDGQYFISSEGKVAQSILDEWQPRVGFVWQPRRAGTAKVFGSYGRFYMDVPLNGLNWYYNGSRRYLVVDWDHDPRIDPSGGDTLGAMSGIQPRIDGMQGLYFDEFTLGYERQVGTNAKVGVRGIYRILGQGLEDGDTPNGYVFDNPGSRDLSAYQHVKRDYTALELTYEQSLLNRLQWRASYVLSRTYGNYGGLFNADYEIINPNASADFDEAIIGNGTGLLPNDRTHVFKLSGSYRAGAGVTLGAVASWESGTPLSELGASKIPHYLVFLVPRGAAGRTPWIWDLNLRVTYAPPQLAKSWARPTLTLDVFHLASQRTAVAYQQMHYWSADAAGNQYNPNPHYMDASEWQPPMAMRLGAEVQF